MDIKSNQMNLNLYLRKVENFLIRFNFKPLGTSNFIEKNVKSFSGIILMKASLTPLTKV